MLLFPIGEREKKSSFPSTSGSVTYKSRTQFIANIQCVNTVLLFGMLYPPPSVYCFLWINVILSLGLHLHSFLLNVMVWPVATLVYTLSPLGEALKVLCSFRRLWTLKECLKNLSAFLFIYLTLTLWERSLCVFFFFFLNWNSLISLQTMHAFLVLNILF